MERPRSDDGAPCFVHTTIRQFDEDQARRARITRLPANERYFILGDKA
jgi:GntR family L-lactate dehydrogenase operon transcriptional regulator